MLEEAEAKLIHYHLLQDIAEFKKGKVEYRADKTGIVHIPFGNVDFSEEDLLVNLIVAVVCAAFLCVIWGIK